VALMVGQVLQHKLGGQMLLPHDEFVFAELKRDGTDQTLRLVFVTHEVLVHGQSLRRIETAMQRMELSLLTKLPSSQRSFVTDGQPVILEIVVTEAKPTDKHSEQISVGLRTERQATLCKTVTL
jgi:hypothetical protein